MGNVISYNISERFTMYPGPRYIKQGEDSGEKFFKEVLDGQMNEAINSDKTLEVILDGTAGYASSFLDEAFGNLVYKYGLDLVKKHLSIISKFEPDWKDMIYNETMPEWEGKRLKDQNK
jgi:hypothetical protein